MLVEATKRKGRAMIIIPDKLRRPAEVERDELRKHLAEAQAEIENLKWHINSEKAKAEAALALNDRALGLVNEARTDAHHWKAECNSLQRMVHEARAVIERKNEELDMFLAEQQAMGEIIEHKDKLIEQMREALKAIDGIGREAGNARREDALRCFAIAAAALAAERGG
jgi:chromosome segregation ATPase